VLLPRPRASQRKGFTPHDGDREKLARAVTIELQRAVEDHQAYLLGKTEARPKAGIPADIQNGGGDGGGEVMIERKRPEHVEGKRHQGERVTKQSPLIDRHVFLTHQEFLKSEAMNGRGEEVLASARILGAQN